MDGWMGWDVFYVGLAIPIAPAAAAGGLVMCFVRPVLGAINRQRKAELLRVNVI